MGDELTKVIGVDEKLLVSPVIIVKSKTAPVPAVMVHCPVPPFIVRVPEPDPTKVPSVTVGLFALKSSVPVKAPHVSDVLLTFVLTVTTPPPELASSVIASAEPGTEAPPEPPVVADQLFVLLDDQMPPATVPPLT